MIPDAAVQRQRLRRLLRERRADVPATSRTTAARLIGRYVAATGWLVAGRNIGLYAAHGTEIDTTVLLQLARQRRCRIYLPRIINYRHRQMRFYRDSAQRDGRQHPLPRHHNRFGIAEPVPATAAPVRWLSALFLPVLGFDADGTRLGSGQGYFDRALHFRRPPGAWRRPLLVGLALECQRVAHIERQTHDVPLDAVITETGIHFFSGGAKP